MKYRASIYLASALAGGLLLIGQAGCSTSQPAQTSTVASPTPTPSVDAAMLAASPSPAASTAPGSAPDGSAAALTPVAPGAAGSTGGSTASKTEVAPKPAPVEVEKPKPPRVYTMGSGTALSVFTASDLSTKTSSSGQAFQGSLARAIVDGDWVIARKGAPVSGVVVQSDPGGKVKGKASIAVRLTSLTLADGRTVDLSTSSYTKVAKGSVKKDAAKIGIGAGVGAAIGAIAGGGKGAAIGAGIGGGGGTGLVMATRGEPAVIPGESQLTFRLTSPVKITRK